MNKELAKIFFEISNYLEIENEPFKPEAYRRASVFLENMDGNILNVYKKGGVKALEDLPIIGKSIALKIEEYIKTGKIKYYENYKKKIPVNFGDLTRVEGVGAKTVRELWKALKVKDLKDLERVAKEGKIKSLPGFGEKSEENILESIEFLKKQRGRISFDEISPLVEEIKKEISSLKEVKKIEVCGSYRRKEKTIGDIDILVATDNPEKVMDYFVNMKHVEKIWGKGPSKSSVRINKGIDVDLRVIPLNQFGSALQYFTGSKEHNIAIRNIAIEKGFKLSEYGLFKEDELIASNTEEDIYSALGFKLIPPEERLNKGELKKYKI
jgi:DNA polymerase (family 10)